MKRFSLIILALLIGFLFTEFLLAVVVLFPRYGVEYKVRYRNGGGTWTNIRKPYSATFNVEGWERVRYNNYGLPGTDLDYLDNLVVVLGSSFVEALQYQGDKIATATFQRELRESGSARQVLNLGCSGHDPYDSWFRLRYYESKLDFNTEDVILVLNSDNRAWFARHQSPLTFDKPSWFGTVNNNLQNKLQTLLRNNSSFIELIARGIKSDTGEDIEPKETNGTQSNEEHEITDELASCLTSFRDEYAGFKVLSILSDSAFNTKLADFCNMNEIELSIRPLTIPENMINGAGHLNLKGNEELGEAMFTLHASKAF